MRREIMAHKFIEFGKFQQHLYGIKVESVLDVINTGKMCVLDVHPQVCDCLCVCVCVCVLLRLSVRESVTMRIVVVLYIQMQ